MQCQRSRKPTDGRHAHGVGALQVGSNVVQKHHLLGLHAKLIASNRKRLGLRFTVPNHTGFDKLVKQARQIKLLPTDKPVLRLLPVREHRWVVLFLTRFVLEVVCQGADFEAVFLEASDTFKHVFVDGGRVTHHGFPHVLAVDDDPVGQVSRDLVGGRQLETRERGKSETKEGEKTHGTALGFQELLELDHILRIRDVFFKELVKLGTDFELAAFEFLEGTVFALGEAVCRSS